MKRTSTYRLAAVLALLLLAGCASQDGGGPPAGGLPPATPSPPVPSTPAPTPGSKEPGQAQPLPRDVLVGVVKAGVEPGCLILAADSGGEWLLLGGDRKVLKVGARVEVTGVQAQGVLTICQQGRPLQVQSARAV